MGMIKASASKGFTPMARLFTTDSADLQSVPANKIQKAISFLVFFMISD